MMDDIQLLGEEGQEFNSNYLVEMSNLLEVELPIPKKLLISDNNAQRALDFLLLNVSEIKVTAVSKISSEQRLELLENLLAKGANVNIQGPYSGDRDTHIIILEKFLSSGDIEIIELLLSYGADVSVSMLTTYSRLPFYAKMRLLMNHGVDLNMSDSDGNILHRILDIKHIGALHYDATSNYVEFLLENGVNPNVSDSNGIYPL